MRILLVLLLAFNTMRAIACPLPEQRQFDFWIGEWDVYAGEKLVGRNRIEAVHGGCALREQYATERGYSGESLNTYDARRKLWHQTWVDSGGLLLQLDGGWREGQMVLEGAGFDAKGQPQRQRISWTPNADGTVRQVWQVQQPDGNWQTAFDGLYRKRR
jgi:Protein of unknown function (DUF1579)